MVLERIGRCLENEPIRVADLVNLAVLGEPEEDLLDEILNLSRVPSTLAKETSERRVVTPREAIQSGADSIVVSLLLRSIAGFFRFCGHGV